MPIVRAVLLAVTLGAAASAAPAPTDYTPASISVQELLARTRKALGAFDPGAYRQVTRTTDASGNVWVATTLTHGTDFRTTVENGGFDWSEGFYEGRSWHRDYNGLVLPSTGYFAQADPFVSALRAVSAQSGDLQLLGIERADPQRYVVEVRPGPGLLERRYYDAHTYLPVRVEMTDYDGHERVWEYGDYRGFYGRTIAQTIGYEQDGVALTERSALVSVDRLAPGSYDLSVPPSRALFDLGASATVPIPARFTDQGIVVRVSIAGRGLDFLLDSGSSDLLIDPAVARELGMTLAGAHRESFAGDFMLANARAPDLSIGPLRAANVAFSTASFSEQLEEQRIVGLLGADFIASGALEVNFADKSVVLLRAAPADPAAGGWSPLALRLDGGVPLLQATFSGQSGYFVADLGADLSTLYPHYFARFPNKIPRGMGDEEEMVTIGGRPFGVTHLTMRDLVLGDWAFGSVQVVVPSASYAQERDIDGLIGRDTLSNFKLLFDYAHAKLWFYPIAPGAR